jgi:UDPglucose--hexose-1-phosphate uridylyltransferase
MPELRTDWLSGRAVVIAENRADRPNEYAAHVSTASASGSIDPATCPFCPGQEHTTPPAVYEVPSEPGQWRIRVVPNKYPIVTLPADYVQSSASIRTELLPAATQRRSPESEPTSPEGAATSAFGAHEVIIESPRHIDRLSDLSVVELWDVLQTYAERLLYWRNDGRFAYGLVFKNQGPRAGASLAHLHSQLIALPTVPTMVHTELRRAEHEFRIDSLCPYCRLVAQERSLCRRLVYDRDGYIAFCPFASLQPYEVWLLPTEHCPSFEQTPPEEMPALAEAVHQLIVRMEAILPEAGYNLLLRTAPWCGYSSEWSHWRIELLPRITPFAGLELASGIFINSLAPERAASKLQSV